LEYRADDVQVQRAVGRLGGVNAEPIARKAARCQRQERGDSNPRPVAVASTYSMERALPTGRAVNELEVVASEPPRKFAVRTTARPTPFHYR
jgi:hypothetical protein